MVRIKLYNFLFALSFVLLGLSSYAQTQTQANPGITSIACPFYIPNAFTPNGDNINERFVLAEGENCRVLKFNIKIFDRWGRMVFDSNDPSPQAGWDGTFEGQELAKGVYIYNVTAQLESANFVSEPQYISRQGTVVLIR